MISETTGPADLVLYTAAEVADLLRLNHQVVQRKLQAGEIPAYRIGREWRVERGQLLAWLESHSNQRGKSSPDAKVLDVFFDAAGRLTSLPAQRKKRLVVVARLAEEFERGRVYSEPQVNAVIRRFHDDVASIRRLLLEEKHLVRTRDGKTYKRTGPKQPALKRA